MPDPYYNEAGYETMRETRENEAEALQYAEKAYVVCRNFIRHALKAPVPGLEDVLAWHYAPMLRPPPMDNDSARTHGRHHLGEAIRRAHYLIEMSERLGPGSQELLLDGEGTPIQTEHLDGVFLWSLSRGAIVTLRRTVKELTTMYHDMLNEMVARDSDKGERMV